MKRYHIRKYLSFKELKTAHQFYTDLTDLFDQLKLNISNLEKNEISNFQKDVIFPVYLFVYY